MLSLLSLILASGTVLRADTEQWSASTYPDPRTNSTHCNTWPNSTLCDPDHILTDQWRLSIHENINRQVERLRNADILYNEDASEECHQNTTEGVKIYVILAKRIQTAANHSTTDTDLTEFGNEVAEQYGLNSLPCKNFLIIVGVEAAKLAYVRTGKDLKLPPNLMEHVFNQYTGLFNAKNYMEGLNNIINEIGEQIVDPFRVQTTAQLAETSEESVTTLSTVDLTAASEIVPVVFSSVNTNVDRQLAPWWMYVLMIVAILCAIVALSLLAVSRCQARKCSQTHMQTIISAATNITSNCDNIKACKSTGKSDQDTEAAYGKDSCVNTVVITENSSEVSSGTDTGNTSLQRSPLSSSHEVLFNYDINGTVQDEHLRHLEITVEGSNVNDGSIATDSQTSTKSDEQSFREERSSVAESDELEYRCEVTRPTTPPKIATKVHLDATALSTDSITNRCTTKDCSELNHL